MGETTLNRKELAELLETTLRNLKEIETKKQLEARLLQKGFKLVNKVKIYKDNIYTIEVVENQTKEEFLGNICKKYKIRGQVKLCKHIINRAKDIKLKSIRTQQEHGEVLKLSRQTISKMDKALMEVKFMKKNGYIYFHTGIDEYGNPYRKQVSEECYRNFWSRHQTEKESLEILREKLASGKLSIKKFELAYKTLVDNLKGEIVHRISYFEEGSQFDKVLTTIESNNQIKFDI